MSIEAEDDCQKNNTNQTLSKPTIWLSFLPGLFLHKGCRPAVQEWKGIVMGRGGWITANKDREAEHEQR